MGKDTRITLYTSEEMQAHIKAYAAQRRMTINKLFWRALEMAYPDLATVGQPKQPRQIIK